LLECHVKRSLSMNSGFLIHLPDSLFLIMGQLVEKRLATKKNLKRILNLGGGRIDKSGDWQLHWFLTGLFELLELVNKLRWHFLLGNLNSLAKSSSFA
jgi:hypothetical protein